MIRLTPPCSRTNRIVFVLGIVCLAILAGLIFVAARNNDDVTFVTISGQVTNNTVALPGVTITLGGSQVGIKTTDSDGFYSFEVPSGGNYTLTPSATGFAFDPPGYTFINLTASRVGNFAVSAQSFVVTNANDNGIGSFREAITNANARLSNDSIIFNIPGPGVKTITLLTPLPEVTDPVVIAATTQPGYAGSPLIELDGTNAGSGANGLVIGSGGSIVEGLAIGGFRAAGIVLRSGNGTGIRANYIGVDATGTVARVNNIGIQLINSSNNLIGGSVATARNVISGNVTGIQISAANNIVAGNFIGTNGAGTAAIGNSNSGINISLGSSFTNNVIGGDSVGAGNLISGNGIGILIQTPLNTIKGNLIGTDITGTHKVGNGTGIQAQVSNTQIGGLTQGARNLISGNDSTGVMFSGNGSKLQGNFIGTDISGTLALGNSLGVRSGDNSLIGGAVPEARNVIAGNGQNVQLNSPTGSPGAGAIVQGNYIGTDVTGTRALGGLGIFILSDHHSITQNVVSGNSVGILFGQSFIVPDQENNCIINGNLIGLNALATGPLPNTSDGISLETGSSNNTISANKIAFNGRTGITLFGGTRNSIRGNSIFSNGGLGIDLGSDGVTPNDPGDADQGVNNLQNFPVITSVSVGNNTTIQGSLNSSPNTTFQIDFFSSAALDPSGHGEGALFLGATTVTTDGNGDATIDVTFPMPLGVGRIVTATATDPNGNTSEFSAGDATAATGNVQFSVDSIRVIEDAGLATITILRKGGISGNLTFNYATVDGTATAGQDYTAASGTLNFNPGETSKSIQIPITDDAITEPDETFTVTLSSPSGLEALGSPATLVVTIQDRTTLPIILQNDVTVLEGNTGSTEMLFTFTLSAATGRSVSADYNTSDLSARGGSSCGDQGTDYETTSGTISFSPGDTSSVTVPVKICGDTSAEIFENFRVNLSNVSNATPDSGHGIGTIRDDDKLELLLDESGPATDQAAALDALLFLRDPFRVSIPEWFPNATDRNTRVMFFVRGLQLEPGESPLMVSVQLSGSNRFAVPAEDVRAVPNVDFAQVVIRLPDNLVEGTWTVSVFAHSQFSNSGTIRIAP